MGSGGRAAVPASRRYWQALGAAAVSFTRVRRCRQSRTQVLEPTEPTRTHVGRSRTYAANEKDLEESCSDNNVPFPDKVAVAERVLDAALGANPEEAAETPVFDANRLHVLTRLRADLATRLGLG